MARLLSFRSTSGAGDLKKVSDTVDTIYTTGIVGALPISVIGILLSGPLLRLINTPDNTFLMPGYI